MRGTSETPSPGAGTGQPEVRCHPWCMKECLGPRVFFLMLPAFISSAQWYDLFTPLTARKRTPARHEAHSRMPACARQLSLLWVNVLQHSRFLAGEQRGISCWLEALRLRGIGCLEKHHLVGGMGQLYLGEDLPEPEETVRCKGVAQGWLPGNVVHPLLWAVEW